MIELKFSAEDIGAVNKQVLAYAASFSGGASEAPTNDAADDKPSESSGRRGRKPKDDAPADEKKADYPTLEQVREVAAQIPGDDDALQDKAFKLVENLGASKLSEIAPEKRQKFITGIEELLANNKKSRRLDD